MWDHLDAPEKQRRLEALAADMDGFDSCNGARYTFAVRVGG